MQRVEEKAHNAGQKVEEKALSAEGRGKGCQYRR